MRTFSTLEATARPRSRQVAVDRMSVPWCAASADDFARKHLRLEGGGGRYWIWQANNADGDHVRFSTDGRWHSSDEPVDGASIVNGRTATSFVGSTRERAALRGRECTQPAHVISRRVTRFVPAAASASV